MLESLDFDVAEPFDCFTEKKNSIMMFQEQRVTISGQWIREHGMF